MKTQDTPRIYVADLAAYNEGFLFGEWIELPVNDLEQEVLELLERTTLLRREALKITEDDTDFVDSEEWAIHDYENLEFYGDVSEYEDLAELNTTVDTYVNLDDQEQKKLSFLMDCQGYNLAQALDQIEDCQIYEDMSFEDLAYEFVDEGLFGDIPEHLTNYIDYSAIAVDLSYDYTAHNGDIFRCD